MTKRKDRERGAIFITTMWVTIALTGLVLVFARAMQIEAIASANRLSQVQAEMAEVGAEQFVKAEIKAEVATPGTTVNVIFSQRQIGGAYVWILKPDPLDEQSRAYGLTDEAGKIDLNTARLSMLQMLPDMPAATASSIYNWRGVATASDGLGATDADYQDYMMKHSPFETVEETLLVKGVDTTLLFGSDTNRDGVIDSSELQSGGIGVAIASATTSARGIFPFVTVYGVRATTSATTGGSTGALVDINSASQQRLTTLFSNAGLSQGPSIISQMIVPGSPGGRGIPPTPAKRTIYANVFDFANRVGLQSTDLSKIYTKITANPAAAGGGGGAGAAPKVAKMNVNNAAKQALMCLPWINQSSAESYAEAIISYVQTNAAVDPTDISWLMDVVPKNEAAQVGGLVTGKSTCYSADIVAVSGDGRAFKRYRIVVDASKAPTTPSTIIYRRDLTGSGWPLDASIRTSMRAGKGPGALHRISFWQRGRITVKRRAGKILGVAIGQKSILIAEVSSKGGAAGAGAAGHLAEFEYPEGLSLDKPAELGKALGAFLRTQRISTKDAVIGLPAKRLVTRRKDVPAAAPAIAASMLRLQAEGEFSSEPDGLVMDFAGKTSSSEQRSVLLIAATRDCVSQCEEMAKAAGLRLRGITATALALGRATNEIPGGDSLVVSLASGGGELIVRHGDSLSQLRHLNIADSAAGDAMNSLAAEIRRTVAGMGRNGSPMSLAVWSGEKRSGSETLEERLNMPVTLPELRSIVTMDTTGSNGFAPAVAVGLAGLDVEGLPVDFLDSRLAPPPVQTNQKKIMWGSIIGGAIVLLVIGALVDLHLLQNQLTNDTKQFDSIKTEYTQAATELDHFRFVRDFAPHKARVTACIRDLTKLFPDEGSVWATTIVLHSDMSGELSGRATSEQYALALRDKMEAAGKLFQGTKRYQWHSSASRNGQATDGTFVINFTYHGTE